MGFVRGASIALSLALAATGLSACGGLGSLGGRGESGDVSERLGIGVNAFLWRASLDTLSFMPLASADPWGGVITYDWYVNPQAPDERFKATVFILDRRLRADALNVSITKEARGADGQWTTTPVSAQTESDLENAILTRARQLNLAAGG